MRWLVEDFKGIKSAQLDIRPGRITVLTGVNSSGKSSIIQSLLLTAQSLYHDGPIILNGPLVRLGDARDLVRESSKRSEIKLALGFDPSIHEELERLEQLQALYKLAPTADSTSLQAREILLEAPPNADFEAMHLTSKRIPTADLEQVIDIYGRSRMSQAYVLRLRARSNDAGKNGRTYVVMEGLKPVQIIQLSQPRPVEQRYRKILSEVLRRSDDTLLPTRDARLLGMGSTIREFIDHLRGGLLRAEVSEVKPDVSELLQHRSARNIFFFDKRWKTLNSDEQDKLIAIAAAERSQKPYVSLSINDQLRTNYVGTGLLEHDFQEKLGPIHHSLSVLAYSLHVFADRVQYLGPLRDEPRVVWNHWNEIGHGLPVGARGEFSAAVLSKSNARPTSYVRPNGESAVAPLVEAVSEWLEYLNIGENVAAFSHGKLGVGLELQVEGKMRDLTSVGVGVSQALPLVVAFLNTPRNSAFIIEQPELHLHPAVQARLAEFFLVARPDMAVVVETHSEAMITRIRRRAAEGTSDISDIDILFVEPSDYGAKARTLHVSEFGDLSEWPTGFLSTAEEDVRAILKAGIRRSREGSNAG